MFVLWVPFLPCSRRYVTCAARAGTSGVCEFYFARFGNRPEGEARMAAVDEGKVDAIWAELQATAYRAFSRLRVTLSVPM